MSRYGEAIKGAALIAQLAAKRRGEYDFKLYPELWSSEDKKIRDFYFHRKWDSVKFVDSAPDTVPNDSGIYMFVVAPHCGGLEDHSYIFYVGKTENLKARYKDYVKEKAGDCDHPREKVIRFLNHLAEYTYFHFTLVPKDELAQAESLLKDNLTPYANSQINIIGRLDSA